MNTDLIKTINKLQDAFASVRVANPIDLPQIAVVGSQSSGKSSVLENIVGRDFLPRGTGIVTRRPLVLQLINRPNSKGEVGGVAAASDLKTDESASKEGGENADDPEEWGEFLHKPGEKFTDFNAIRDEIVNDTEKRTGKNAGISPLPINLRIYSPNVLTLTLIDLPGLTKVPVGDQPKDIEKQIRDMLNLYITKASTIILAVTAANTDLANSDGLKLAREVDPEGSRTIGVLTKVDLMDDGTDVVDILAGRVIPLRLGYVPVVNRGQRDIETKKKISVALEKERQFFEQHNAYRSKAQYCGTPFLARKLNLILMHHIRNSLPEMKAKIQSGLQRFNQELLQLGDAVDEDPGSQSRLVLKAITEFTNDYHTLIDGTSSDVSSEELSGGARISFVFHEIFGGAIRELDPLDQIKDVDIRTILFNIAGYSPSLFVGTQAFEVLVKKQIVRLEEPSMKCNSMIYDELVRILNKLLQKQVFKQYPSLRERFYNVVMNLFKRCMSPTNKLVQDLIAAEVCYINTGHPDFLSGHKAMMIVTDRINASKAPTPTPFNQHNPNDPKNARPLPPPNGQFAHLSTALPQRDANAEIIAQSQNQDGFFGGLFSRKNKPGSNGALENPPSVLKASGKLNEREFMEIEIIKLLILSYFNIVKRTVADIVPKAIMLNLVQQSKKEMQAHLIAEVYKENIFNDSLKESDVTQARRSECKQMIEALQKADEIINGV